MAPEFRLLSVHAHPDDESSKGAPTVARYHDLGVGTTLVCGTGGEAGDILNPAMDLPEVRENIGEIRLNELKVATAVIGYENVDLLGYHDSGMPDTETNARPDNFWNAPIEESTERLVRIIRRDRPHVILTYRDERDGGYNHPDHVRVHEISLPAFDRAGDPDWYPEAGEPWTPLKMYYAAWSRKRMLALHEKFLELGIESPFDDEWFKRWEERGDTDAEVTTQIDIRGYYGIREKALLAHATQIDPNSAFWFGLPTEVTEELHPYEDYILAASRVDSPVPEEDIFAGVPGWSGL
jgi:mycothiol S-conjugate amidase